MTRSNQILIATLFAFLSPSISLSQVIVIEAPSNVEFVDLGYDVESDEVGIVGQVAQEDESIATLFELDAENNFVSQTLADLPEATGNAEVFGISSDASRIAGVSLSTDSDNQGEGVSWQRSSPSTPEGIGFVGGFNNFSLGVGAWVDGIVGEFCGGFFACTWSEEDGIEALPGTEGGVAGASGVSANGEIVVGFSSHEVLNGAAYYWDDEGIHRLDDEIDGFTLFQSTARAVSPDGNTIGGFIAAQDDVGAVKVFAVVWEGALRTLRILLDSEGNRVEGIVNDVSNLGYAVGAFAGGGFISHESLGESVVVFEDWLADREEDFFPTISSSAVGAISEDRVNGKLRFIVSDTEGISSFVEVEVPEILPLLGDVDSNGTVNNSDIMPFVNVLFGISPYQLEADMDVNGFVDSFDVALFFVRLFG